LAAIAHGKREAAVRQEPLCPLRGDWLRGPRSTPFDNSSRTLQRFEYGRTTLLVLVLCHHAVLSQLVQLVEAVTH
jgi:hypothetical protein